jgi:hypothetical protein
VRTVRSRIHPALLLFLALMSGAGGLYFFSSGVSELLQINHEMTELLTKGNTAVISDQSDPVRIHFGWRLVLGTAILGVASLFFRWLYEWWWDVCPAAEVE